MSISYIGGGLSIIISCEYVVHHDWMSFLSFWSIRKNLPDAKLTIACRRGVSSDIFSWTRRCSVPIIYHKLDSNQEIKDFLLSNPRSKVENPVLIVLPEFIFLRDFDEADFDTSVLEHKFDYKEIPNLVSNIKTQNPTVCCDYSDGWGNFVTSEWINKASIPLYGIDYSKQAMSVNEGRLARLWESATTIYQSISRG
jgi:hypothetical protein